MTEVVEREGQRQVKKKKKTEILTYTDKHKKRMCSIPRLHYVKFYLYTYREILTFNKNGLY